MKTIFNNRFRFHRNSWVKVPNSKMSTWQKTVWQLEKRQMQKCKDKTENRAKI